ncbi:MAG: NYN domain-containing protein [Actinomycetota bacterium]
MTLLGCCNDGARRRLAFRFPQVRMFGHCGGPDAADHELLERINRDIPPSCDTVVIGSGDGIFAGVAREFRARGLRVEVIARAGSIAAGLYRAAHECHLIDDGIAVSA